MGFNSGFKGLNICRLSVIQSSTERYSNTVRLLEGREGEPFNTSAVMDQLSVMSCTWFRRDFGHDENVYVPYQQIKGDIFNNPLKICYALKQEMFKWYTL